MTGNGVLEDYVGNLQRHEDDRDLMRLLYSIELLSFSFQTLEGAFCYVKIEHSTITPLVCLFTKIICKGISKVGIYLYKYFKISFVIISSK